MPKLIVANWKMNPASVSEAEELFTSTIKCALPEIQIIVAPSFIHLSTISKIGKPINCFLSSQDLFWESFGAYTGEVSGAQLLNIGVTYSIIGHSERRKNLNETNEMISKKVEAAISSKIIPILCVGETKEERESGIKNKVITEEIKTALGDIEKAEEIIIAYEPIWAIGTGIPDKPEDTLETFKLIKNVLRELGRDFKVKLIYGGSVDSKNIENFIKHEEIEGVLVGRASLDINEIKKILEITASVR